MVMLMEMAPFHSMSSNILLVKQRMATTLMIQEAAEVAKAAEAVVDLEVEETEAEVYQEEEETEAEVAQEEEETEVEVDQEEEEATALDLMAVMKIKKKEKIEKDTRMI